MSNVKYVAKAPCEDQDTLLVLFKSIDILLKNIELIKSVPENYYIEIKGAGVMGMYIGSFPLYLGDLLQLWNNPSAWSEKSENETKYIYHMGGFPTAGQCFLKMYNTKTCRTESEERSHFINYYNDAIQLFKDEGDDGCDIEVLKQNQKSALPIARLACLDHHGNKTLRELLNEIK